MKTKNKNKGSNKQRIIFFVLALFLGFSTYTPIVAQNVAIDSTGTVGSTYAVLDLSQSTNGGLLLPSVTTTQMSALTPPAGTLIFNNTLNCLEVYYSGSWQSIICPCSGVPSAPGTPGGAATITASSTGNVYSITPVSGATSYTWTVPAGIGTISAGSGTNSITITANTVGGGPYNMTVTASNACGTSVASGALAVTVTGGVSHGTLGFNYTGSNQTWTVPTGITSVTVQCWGAGGGGTGDDNSNGGGLCDPYTPAYANGGPGGYIAGILTLTSGWVMTIVVGEGGKEGGNTATFGGGGANGQSGDGGSGGGMSAILHTGTYYVIAGGGGGAGSTSTDNNGNCTDGYSWGGGGGGATGQTGGGDGGGCNGCGDAETGGGGGTQAAGGAGGTCQTGYDPGAAGSLHTGGSGNSDGIDGDGGGGGGGGYYGGGGGPGYWGAGGGGGSNYPNGTVAPFTNFGASTTWTPAGYGAGGLQGVSSHTTYSSAPAPYTGTNYSSGVGAGGSGSPTGNGGNGYVFLTW